MNELEARVEMTEPYLHTTFIRGRCAYFWNKQREQIPGICWSSLCLPLVSASRLPCQRVQTNRSCALKSHNWQIQGNTDTSQTFTGVCCIVCSLNKLKLWTFSWCSIIFRQPHYYLDRLWIHHQDRGIHIYLSPTPYTARWKAGKLSSKIDPKDINTRKNFGIRKYKLYMFVQNDHLSFSFALGYLLKWSVYGNMSVPHFPVYGLCSSNPPSISRTLFINQNYSP